MENNCFKNEWIWHNSHKFLSNSIFHEWSSFFQVILVLGDEKDPNKGIKGVIDIDDDDDDDFGSMMFKGSSGSTGTK